MLRVAWAQEDLNKSYFSKADDLRHGKNATPANTGDDAIVLTLTGYVKESGRNAL